MWRVDEGVQRPSWKGLKGGDTPSSPLFSRGRTGWMGRHVTRGMRLDWCRTHFVRSWSLKMGDFPVLPDDVLLMIAREYCLATVEDRALDGW